ncbi:PTS system mannose/fructose/sorbose family transporter subunit IID [Caproiciproducens sp. CPB-2]|uniref:PTS system mannose/fructose/sorbose family transporter subunit IID n=1 Tax=Caproiciproducens sp. CPB-2 TaxID=3030017 RepID=UPI0023DC3864|nr:PTS system mannose/fructose/sorbose family transporter subunit IID [Caproiciproducens sp. CPB-2]MDF1494539.1 PTS system mannose/fructose/sorbose family transporter subunit IID [Caproiciproducens sp. CPB-2]
MMISNSNGEKKLDKKDLRKIFLRSISFSAFYNYPKQQNVGFCYAILPAIKKLYSKKEDRVSAMKRHLEYFLTAPYMSGFIFGSTVAMEEENVNNPNFDVSSIGALKLALMGPLAGIGDSMFMGTLRIIGTGMAAGLCMSGSILGPILIFLILNIPNFLVRYYGFYGSYRMGTKVLNDVESSKIMEKITYACTIVGLMVVGGMIASNVNLNLAMSITIGKTQTTIQSFIDSVMPKLLPLGLTGFVYWLLQKKVSVLAVIIGILICGTALGAFGII